MSVWTYVLDDEAITEIHRDDRDAPEEGTRLTFVGRLGIPAPAEHFIFSRVYPAQRTAYLERQPR